MDAGRKRVLLIAASILAARKLAQYDGGKRVPATVAAIADAIRWGEEIMKAIDNQGREYGSSCTVESLSPAAFQYRMELRNGSSRLNSTGCFGLLVWRTELWKFGGQNPRRKFSLQASDIDLQCSY